MNRLIVPVLIAVAAVTVGHSATAATVSRSYSYFTLRGATWDELQQEMARRGPEVEATGRRHPGATRLSFTNRIRYLDSKGKCRVASAAVTVRARIILPHWIRRNAGSAETRQIWDALSSDIKRHEESHVSIAKNHARDMEQAIMALPAQKNCDQIETHVRKSLSDGIARHDAEQARFDRIEGKNFSTRLERLMRYRASQ